GARDGPGSGPVGDVAGALHPVGLVGPESPTAAPPGRPVAVGPRIQIYDSQASASGPALNLVYDSAAPVAAVPRRRLFTWDSTRGIVNFALRAETTQQIRATGGGVPEEIPYSLSLKRDRQTIPLPLATNPDPQRQQPVPA